MQEGDRVSSIIAAKHGPNTGFVFFVIGCVIVFVGCASMNWRCDGRDPPLRGCAANVVIGPTDTTLSTTYTCYLLSVAHAFMAVDPPGAGYIRHIFRMSSVVDAFCWTSAGLMHHIAPLLTDQMHYPFWYTALILGVVASTLRTVGAGCAFKNGGISQSHGSGGSVIQVIFVGFLGMVLTCGLVMCIYLQNTFYLTVTLETIAIFIQVAIFTKNGVRLHTLAFALVILILSWVVKEFPSSPFLYSTTFNSSGLFHCGTLLVVAADYQLLYTALRLNRQHSPSGEFGARAYNTC